MTDRDDYYDRELADTVQRERMKHWVCQAPGCTVRPATRIEGRWRFCREHAPLWRTHNRIVDRILSIPPRPPRD